MNDKSYMYWKNNWMQKLDRDSRRHLNCFRFSKPKGSRKKKSETEAHIKEKLRVLLGWLKEYGDIDYLTEVYSADRSHRADLVLFVRDRGPPVVIEIGISEKQESMDAKQKFWEDQGFEFVRSIL